MSVSPPIAACCGPRLGGNSRPGLTAQWCKVCAQAIHTQVELARLTWGDSSGVSPGDRARLWHSMYAETRQPGDGATGFRT